MSSKEISEKEGEESSEIDVNNTNITNNDGVTKTSEDAEETKNTTDKENSNIKDTVAAPLPPTEDSNSSNTVKSDDTEGLSLDKTITRFRFQYDKLHRSLARSMETERRLVNETKNLRLQLIDNSKKIELAYKWKSEDQKQLSCCAVN